MNESQAKLQELDPTVLIENEQDLTAFPDDEFEFIKKTKYVAFNPAESPPSPFSCAAEGHCCTSKSKYMFAKYI